MALRYITIDEFLNGQKGMTVNIGPDECFKTPEDLIFFLTSIEELVDNYLGRKLNLDVYTEYFWGKDNTSRQLKNFPIVSVDSITYISLSETEPVEIDPSNYIVTRNIIQFPQKFLSTRYYTVVYTGGFTPEEFPTVIKQAIIEQAALTLMEESRGIIHSESGMNNKLVYEPTPLPLYPAIEQKLRPYKRIFHYL